MNFLKVLLVTVFMLVGYNAMADHHEIKCEIELQRAGIYSRYCPPGTLMDANATRVNLAGGPRPIVFVYDDVRCVRPVIKCEKVEELVDSELETE